MFQVLDCFGADGRRVLVHMVDGRADDRHKVCNRAEFDECSTKSGHLVLTPQTFVKMSVLSDIGARRIFTFDECSERNAQFESKVVQKRCKIQCIVQLLFESGLPNGHQNRRPEGPNLTNVSRNRFKGRFRQVNFLINLWLDFFAKPHWYLRFQGPLSRAPEPSSGAPEIADTSAVL